MPRPSIKKERGVWWQYVLRAVLRQNFVTSNQIQLFSHMMCMMSLICGIQRTLFIHNYPIPPIQLAVHPCSLRTPFFFLVEGCVDWGVWHTRLTYNFIVIYSIVYNVMYIHGWYMWQTMWLCFPYPSPVKVSYVYHHSCEDGIVRVCTVTIYSDVKQSCLWPVAHQRSARLKWSWWLLAEQNSN